jgi:hypothetical protein
MTNIIIISIVTEIIKMYFSINMYIITNTQHQIVHTIVDSKYFEKLLGDIKIFMLCENSRKTSKRGDKTLQEALIRS